MKESDERTGRNATNEAKIISEEARPDSPGSVGRCAHFDPWEEKGGTEGEDRNRCACQTDASGPA
jgi:hypothetical protein